MSDDQTVNGSNAQSNADTGSTDAPGRRLHNPLANLASYTYQLSLYMITPDAYDAFVQTGRTSIDALAQASGEKGKGSGGAYLVAQSGGINNNTSQRIPGFEWDYYIDKLQIDQVINAKATQSSSNAYRVQFEIIEPYGFSFTTKLKQANDALQQYFNDSGYSLGLLSNGSRQFFVLGIKFLGYDQSGNIVDGDDTFSDGDGPIDPAASGTNLFETFYDVLITSIKFKIDGPATRYTLSGVSAAPGSVFGTKRGRLKSTKTVCGKTLEDALTGKRGLLTQLNKIQTALVEKGTATIANEFRVEFIGDDADALKNARLINPLDTDKSKWCQPEIENTYQANDAEAAKAVPDDAQRRVVFTEDTPMIEVFDQLLKDSSYMRDALLVVYSNNPTPNLDTGKQESSPGGGTRVAWYHVTPEISNAKWDPIVADWAYVTTYKLETYQTPVVISATTNPGMDYYGPHKRYEYWWTGQNSEILSYEQLLDNLFYNEVLAKPDIDKDGQGTGGDAQTSLSTPNRTAMPTLNSLGGGLEAQNNYITSLYSPDSFAEAKIKLMGDPDFLVTNSRGGPNAVYQRFYGDDGFRINANGGQVFIEIDFKEAVDYNSETGIMDINDSIVFWKYPAWAAEKIKGVSYTVIQVKSVFEGGKFTQELKAVINTFTDAATSPDGDPRADIDALPRSGSGNDARTDNLDMGVLPANINEGQFGPFNSGLGGYAFPNDDQGGT